MKFPMAAVINHTDQVPLKKTRNTFFFIALEYKSLKWVLLGQKWRSSIKIESKSPEALKEFVLWHL